MTDESQNPFVTGARVAIEDAWNNDKFTEAFVEKIYKTGNFTLKGSAQQWRPYSPATYRHFWSANATGSHGFRVKSLRIWDDTTDAVIKSAMTLDIRRRRLRILQDRLNKMAADDTTDTMLDAIEAVLPKAKK